MAAQQEPQAVVRMLPRLGRREELAGRDGRRNSVLGGHLRVCV